MADVVHLLSVSYSGAKEERLAATAQLEAVLKGSDGIKHALVLLQAGTSSSVSNEQSMLALICAKNYVVRDMDEGVVKQYPQEVEQMKCNVFQAALAMPLAQRRVLHQCIATMVSAFSWNFLHQLIPMVLEASATVATASAAGEWEKHSALLELLYVFMKRFKSSGLEPMAMKVEACKTLVQPLSAFLALNHMRIYHMVFKNLECVIETALQLKAGAPLGDVVPHEVLDAWFQLLRQFPEQHHQAAAAGAAGGASKEYADYVTCVKRIAMISYSLLNDATRRKKPAEIAAHFLRRWGAEFLGMWKQWLSYCVASSDRETHKKSEMYAIRFVKICTLDRTLYTQHLRADVLSIIENLLFPYLCYGASDDEIFADEDNLAEFVQYMVDESVGSGELSQRQAASNAILSLLDGKRGFHDNAVLTEILQTLQQGLSQADTPENFHRTFGFMHLLSILRKQLRERSDVWSSQVGVVLIHLVIPRALPTSPHVALRTKAIAVCQRYSKVPFPSPGDFQHFVELMCTLITDSDARVRLASIDSMCTLLEMRRARQFLRPILVALVDESLRLMEKVQTTFIPTVLLFLTEHFAPELTSVLDKLASSMVQQFLAAAFEIEAGETNDAIDDADMQRFEQTALSGSALLDALSTVVTASYRNMEAFVSMRPDLLRLVKRVLQFPDNYDFVEKTLVILLHVINFSKPITPECWEVLPMVFHIVDTGVGIDYFNLIEEVLDNFVSNAAAEYLTNDAIMGATYSVCHKMLLGGVICSEEQQYGAPQLVEAMLHQAKHCAAAPGLFDKHLQKYVVLLLQALISEGTAQGPIKLRVWILMALCDAFYYNAEATLHIMVDSNAYPKFFDGFFLLLRGIFADEQAPVPKKGKCKGASSSDREAQEVIESLSILTRKVFILGLTALLAVVSSPSHPLHSTFHPTYTALTLRVISYCIAENEKRYELRCRVAEKNIAKARTGTLDDEEDAPDVDQREDEVLGLDGGDDVGEDEEDDVEEGEWNAPDDAVNSDLGDMEDEGDDYESPIDDICEVEYFLSWANLFGATGGLQPLANAMLPTDTLIRAEGTARRYRELCKALESVSEELHHARAAQ